VEARYALALRPGHYRPGQPSDAQTPRHCNGRVAQSAGQSRQARRIARKLEDYTGDVKQAESLRRELAKLEAVQREKQFRNEIERQKSQDLQDAARELDAILADDEDAFDLLMANYDLEADLLLAVFGIGRLI
jgi:hypothetical protein